MDAAGLEECEEFGWLDVAFGRHQALMREAILENRVGGENGRGNGGYKTIFAGDNRAAADLSGRTFNQITDATGRRANEAREATPPPHVLFKQPL
jgi:hypothetical protein